MRNTKRLIALRPRWRPGLRISSLASQQARWQCPPQHFLADAATRPQRTIANGFCNGNFIAGTPRSAALAHFHENIHTGELGPEANANPDVGLDFTSSASAP